MTRFEKFCEAAAIVGLVTFAVGMIVMYVAFLAALVYLLPVVAIWSLNTLFGLSIAVTLRTWLAVWFLVAILGDAPKIRFKVK